MVEDQAPPQVLAGASGTIAGGPSSPISGAGSGLCPHSPAIALAPTRIRPPIAMPPPTPVPRITPNTVPWPAPAPSIASDKAKQLASLAKRTGRPSAASTSRPSGWPISQVELAFLTSSVAATMVPGIPIPTEARFLNRAHAAAVDNIAVFFGEDIFIAIGSILFGGIVSAAIKMQILAGVPSAASPLIQALILLGLVALLVFSAAVAAVLLVADFAGLGLSRFASGGHLKPRFGPPRREIFCRFSQALLHTSRR